MQAVWVTPWWVKGKTHCWPEVVRQEEPGGSWGGLRSEGGLKGGLWSGLWGGLWGHSL